MSSQTAPEARESAHAKLLTYGQRQVLAYLYRDENDRLTTVLQLWVASSDEQLRIAIDYPGMSEEVVWLLFQELDDEQIAGDLERLGVPEILEGGAG